MEMLKHVYYKVCAGTKYRKMVIQYIRNFFPSPQGIPGYATDRMHSQ